MSEGTFPHPQALTYHTIISLRGMSYTLKRRLMPTGMKVSMVIEREYFQWHTSKSLKVSTIIFLDFGAKRALDYTEISDSD